ncbi:MAG: hypothetical protein PUD50_07850 [Eubacteriales bacterium]|nr:hypothetical protein [Eubacteriales bacterium]
MKTLVKTLVLCLCALLVLAPMSMAEVSITEPGAMPVVNEPAELNIFLFTSTAVGDMNTNDFTAWYEEQTGVHINWEVYTDKETAKTKANALIASGDLPDVFVGVNFSALEAVMYGNEGYFIDLKPWFEEYGYYINQMFEEQPSILSDITDNEGHIWGFPNYAACYHCETQQRGWIYTPWLEQYKEATGKGKPATTEEFYEMLKFFKENDMNGDGDTTDEIPFAGAVDGWGTELPGMFMSAFEYFDQDESYVEYVDGTVRFVADSDGWKEGLRYVNKLYTEGLIAPESVTQSPSQLLQMGENPGKVVLGSAFASNANGTIFSLGDEDGRYLNWEPIEPLEGPTGLKQVPETKQVANMAAFVTSSCKNPELVVRWFDWCYSREGNLSVGANGIPGVNWVVPEEGQMGYGGVPATFMVTEETRERRNNNDGTYRWQWPVRYQPLEVTFSEIRVPNADGYDNETFLYNAANFLHQWMVPHDLPVLFYTSEQTEEIAELTANLKDYIGSWTVEFITGLKDIDADWDTYVAGLEKNQVDQYVSIMQAACDAKSGN